MSPHITVLMPVFNRELYVDEAIESVLAQDFADFELVLVDDGSTDRTPEILRGWAERDPRIVVITLPSNQGIPAALNAGLGHARAPYVARLDSDDVMTPGRLTAQVAVLEDRPDVILVSSAYETMDPVGNYTGTWLGDEPHEVVTLLLNFYNIVGGGGQVMFRRSEVADEGGYATAYPSSEDYDLWVRLLRRGRILTLPMIGMKQRNHRARSSLQYANVKRSNWIRIMRDSLGRYLERPIRDEEIAALLTVWRHDGATGMAPAADRTMREAFARFCRLHSDRELRRCARNRIARQWLEAAGMFTKAGDSLEAARYVARAACWSPAIVFHAVAGAPRRAGSPSAAARIALRSYRILSRARPLVRLIPQRLRRNMREFLLGRRDPAPRPVRHRSLPPGLNIIGYTSRLTGVGESARLCQQACEAAGLASALMDVDGTNESSRQATYRASLSHVNADQTLDVHRRLARVFDASAYNIACWHWELPELPDEWIAAAAPLDEIWAPSTFIQNAIRRKISIPVLHMPHGVEITNISPCSPDELGVPPGRFTFLCIFDLTSITRKNPLGAVEAFRRAFPRESNVALLIKASRAERHRQRFADLEERLHGIPNVYLTSQMLPRPRINGLVAACDAVVSLHHSEGFGLIPAEAMSLGKPVVATGWSGNTDFMTADNSCLVDSKLVPIESNDVQPHGAGQQWAEPDLDHAARLMRRLVEDAEYRQQIGERARRTMETRFSARAAGERYRARLEELGLMK